PLRRDDGARELPARLPREPDRRAADGDAPRRGRSHVAARVGRDRRARAAPAARRDRPRHARARAVGVQARGSEDRGEPMSEVDDLKRENARLWAENNRLRAERREVEYYEALAEQMQGSLSWQITTPLRSAKTLAVKVRRKL